jgi:hypothetical protein
VSNVQEKGFEFCLDTKNNRALPLDLACPSGDHPNKDFTLMVTRYWKTLKTVETLAEKT